MTRTLIALTLLALCGCGGTPSSQADRPQPQMPTPSQPTPPVTPPKAALPFTLADVEAFLGKPTAKTDDSLTYKKDEIDLIVTRKGEAISVNYGPSTETLTFWIKFQINPAYFTEKERDAASDLVGDVRNNPDKRTGEVTEGRYVIRVDHDKKTNRTTETYTPKQK